MVTVYIFGRNPSISKKKLLEAIKVQRLETRIFSGLKTRHFRATPASLFVS